MTQSLFPLAPGDVVCPECQGVFSVPLKRHRKAAHRKPGIFHWRQRRWWSWLVGQMYVTGIICGSTASSHKNGWIVHSLHWRGRRPYILWMQGFSWGRVALWHRLRRGHWPQTIAMGFCGVCVPWSCCGATGNDHAEGCPDA